MQAILSTLVFCCSLKGFSVTACEGAPLKKSRFLIFECLYSCDTFWSADFQEIIFFLRIHTQFCLFDFQQVKKFALDGIGVSSQTFSIFNESCLGSAVI